MSSDEESQAMSDSEILEASKMEDWGLEKPKVTFTALLRRILQGNPPLSGTHPGYLLGFVTMLETENNLPVELENSLHGLQKAAKIWNNGIGKASKRGVIEYLQSCTGLMGNLFATSFDSRTLESVKTFLDAYNETDVTEEDCCRFVEKTLMSTSHTTATSATGRAGATGGKKRKHTELTCDEIDVHIDEIPVEVEQRPTFKTYSSTIVRKHDQYYIKKLEDKWKEYTARVTIWRKQDLMECPRSFDKWKYKYQELDLNYNSGTSIWKMMNQIKGHHMQYLDEKNVSWEPKKEHNYGH
jgi:hypothetical protein